jgi:hypothetical protein
MHSVPACLAEFQRAWLTGATKVIVVAAWLARDLALRLDLKAEPQAFGQGIVNGGRNRHFEHVCDLAAREGISLAVIGETPG